MIKFIPNEHPAKSLLADPENSIYNLSNKTLAEKLNTRFGEKGCDDHPYFENVFVVDLSKKDNFLMLKSWCCEKFKSTLDLISQNKDPYSEK